MLLGNTKKAPTTPQHTVVDLDGGQTVTANEELLLDSETDRVPMQNRPIAAAGERLLTGKGSWVACLCHNKTL